MSCIHFLRYPVVVYYYFFLRSFRYFFKKIRVCNIVYFPFFERYFRVLIIFYPLFLHQKCVKMCKQMRQNVSKSVKMCQREIPLQIKRFIVIGYVDIFSALVVNARIDLFVIRLHENLPAKYRCRVSPCIIDCHRVCTIQ